MAAHVTAAFPVIDRLLKPLPYGVIESLARQLGPGTGLIAEPFCRGDRLARVLLRQGHRVVLADSNPLVTFVVRAAFQPLPARELHRAFTWLGNAMTHQTLLRIHLDELYATTCPRCSQPAIARYFLWRQETPIAKACLCEYCRYETDELHGLDPVDDADLIAASRIDARRAAERLFRRVVAEGSRHEHLAARLFDLYTPRALYAIDQLLWTIERGADSPDAEAGLKLIALHVLDVCRKLDPVAGPAGVAEFEPSDSYRERNLWQAFEEGYDLARRLAEAHAADLGGPRLAAEIDQLLDAEADDESGLVPTACVETLAPDQLASLLPAEALDALVGVLPGPDRGATYALSALWAGWLLGADAAEPLLDLAQVAYAAGGTNQWPAYYQTVRDGLSDLAPALRAGGRALLVCASDDPAEVATVALAGAAAGLEIETVRFQPFDTAALGTAAAYGGSPGHYLLQLTKPANWRPEAGRLETSGVRELAAEIGSGGREAVGRLLNERNEPVPWSWLYGAILEHLGRAGTLRRLIRLLADQPAQALRQLASALRDELEPAVRRDALLRLEVEREFGGGMLWSLPAVSSQHPPVSERIERSVYNVLVTAPSIADARLDHLVSGLFHGHTAPDPGFVRELLNSYSVQASNGVWSLRIPDQFAARTQEHRQVLGWLVELGHQLGFLAWVNRNEHLRDYRHGKLKDLLTPLERGFSLGQWLGNPRAEEIDVVWYGPGRPTLVFEVEWMAMLTDALLRRRVALPGVRRYLVTPRDRVPLLHQRLARQALLRLTFGHDAWTLVDYEDLGVLGDLSPASVDRAVEFLGLDGVRRIASA